MANADPEMDTCCVCDEAFATDFELAAHLIRHAEEMQIAEEENEQISSNSAQDALVLTPPITQSDFDTVEIVETEPILPPPRRIRTVRPQEQREMYNCYACDFKSGNYRLLKTHMLIHEKKENEEICGICEKTFPEKGLLMQHLHAHKAQKLHKCSRCSKKFTIFAVFTKHCSTKHGIVLPI